MNLKRKAFLAAFLLLLSSFGLFAQKIVVKGVVLDDEGLPFPGAGVVESGTMNGVAADLNGQFSIQVMRV